MGREHNWADNHTFTGRIQQPGSIDELRRLVARATKVRALGARHSFNAIADSPGDLVDLGGIPADFRLDPERRTVTFGAGVNYGVLAAWLHANGWALHNTASLPHITVAGAIMTGTHGSGDRLGNLASAVAALDLVGPEGDLATVRRGDAGFDGMVVGLGALGIVTRVSLDIEPSFALRQDAFEGLSWEALLGDFDAVMGAGYSVSLMTAWSAPTVSRWWVKTRLAAGAPESAPDGRFGCTLAEHPSVRATPEALARLNPFGRAGPWCDRLPHFRNEVMPGPEGHLQSEYMLPRGQATAAIATLRAIGERIDRHLWATEIRSMAADNLWLSPAYGDDRVAIHFSWLREPATIVAMTAEIEDLLLPLGARPHWGKIMHAPAARLSPLYPQLAAFRDLAHTRDPSGKFRNTFLDTHVFGYDF